MPDPKDPFVDAPLDLPTAKSTDPFVDAPLDLPADTSHYSNGPGKGVLTTGPKITVKNDPVNANAYLGDPTKPYLDGGVESTTDDTALDAIQGFGQSPPVGWVMDKLGRLVAGSRAMLMGTEEDRVAQEKARHEYFNYRGEIQDPATGNVRPMTAQEKAWFIQTHPGADPDMPIPPPGQSMDAYDRAHGGGDSTAMFGNPKAVMGPIAPNPAAIIERGAEAVWNPETAPSAEAWKHGVIGPDLATQQDISDPTGKINWVEAFKHLTDGVMTVGSNAAIDPLLTIHPGLSPEGEALQAARTSAIDAAARASRTPGAAAKILTDAGAPKTIVTPADANAWAKIPFSEHVANSNAGVNFTLPFTDESAFLPIPKQLAGAAKVLDPVVNFLSKAGEKFTGPDQQEMGPVMQNAMHGEEHAAVKEFVRQKVDPVINRAKQAGLSDDQMVTLDKALEAANPTTIDPVTKLPAEPMNFRIPKEMLGPKNDLGGKAQTLLPMEFDPELARLAKENPDVYAKMMAARERSTLPFAPQMSEFMKDYSTWTPEHRAAGFAYLDNMRTVPAEVRSFAKTRGMTVPELNGKYAQKLRDMLTERRALLDEEAAGGAQPPTQPPPTQPPPTQPPAPTATKPNAGSTTLPIQPGALDEELAGGSGPLDTLPGESSVHVAPEVSEAPSETGEGETPDWANISNKEMNSRIKPQEARTEPPAPKGWSEVGAHPDMIDDISNYHRDVLLQEAARNLGIKLSIHDGDLVHPDTGQTFTTKTGMKPRGVTLEDGRVLLQRQATLAGELRTLGHESIHSIIKDMPAEAQHGIIQRVVDALGEKHPEVAQKILERWDNHVTTRHGTPDLGAMEEILADAGGMHFTSPEFIKALGGVADKSILTRVLEKIQGMMDAVGGALGLAPKESVPALQKIADELIQSRRAARKALSEAPEVPKPTELTAPAASGVGGMSDAEFGKHMDSVVGDADRLQAQRMPSDFDGTGQEPTPITAPAAEVQESKPQPSPEAQQRAAERKARLEAREKAAQPAEPGEPSEQAAERDKYLGHQGWKKSLASLTEEQKQFIHENKIRRGNSTGTEGFLPFQKLQPEEFRAQSLDDQLQKYVDVKKIPAAPKAEVTVTREEAQARVAAAQEAHEAMEFDDSDAFKKWRRGKGNPDLTRKDWRKAVNLENDAALNALTEVEKGSKRGILMSELQGKGEKAIEFKDNAAESPAKLAQLHEEEQALWERGRLPAAKPSAEVPEEGWDSLDTGASYDGRDFKQGTHGEKLGEIKESASQDDPRMRRLRALDEHLGDSSNSERSGQRAKMGGSDAEYSVKPNKPWPERLAEIHARLDEIHKELPKTVLQANSVPLYRPGGASDVMRDFIRDQSNPALEKPTPGKDPSKAQRQRTWADTNKEFADFGDVNSSIAANERQLRHGTAATHGVPTYEPQSAKWYDPIREFFTPEGYKQMKADMAEAEGGNKFYKHSADAWKDQLERQYPKALTNNALQRAYGEMYDVVPEKAVNAVRKVAYDGTEPVVNGKIIHQPATRYDVEKAFTDAGGKNFAQHVTLEQWAEIGAGAKLADVFHKTWTPANRVYQDLGNGKSGYMHTGAARELNETINLGNDPFQMGRFLKSYSPAYQYLLKESKELATYKLPPLYPGYRGMKLLHDGWRMHAGDLLDSGTVGDIAALRKPLVEYARDGTLDAAQKAGVNLGKAGTMNGADFIRKLERHDLIDSGEATTEFGKTKTDGGLWDNWKSFAKDSLKADDNVVRASAFAKLLRDGVPESEAAFRVEEAMFNFKKTGPYTQALRQTGIVPFATWHTKVMPFMAKYAMENPGEYAYLMKTYAAMGDGSIPMSQLPANLRDNTNLTGNMRRDKNGHLLIDMVSSNGVLPGSELSSSFSTLTSGGLAGLPGGAYRLFSQHFGPALRVADTLRQQETMNEKGDLVRKSLVDNVKDVAAAAIGHPAGFVRDMTDDKTTGWQKAQMLTPLGALTPKTVDLTQQGQITSAVMKKSVESAVHNAVVARVALTDAQTKYKSALVAKNYHIATYDETDPAQQAAMAADPHVQKYQAAVDAAADLVRRERRQHQDAVDDAAKVRTMGAKMQVVH